MARPRQILIVDDEYDLADLLKTYFEVEGSSAEICGSGLEALVALKTKPYDVVLTDIAMPVMDGADLLYELRKQKASPPVILMTGYNNIAVEDIFDRGAYEILRKPFSPQDALRVILKVALPMAERWALSEPLRWKPTKAIYRKFPAYQTAKVEGKINLGKGGFYLSIIPDLVLATDDVVSFNIEFEDPNFNQLTGIGRVRWVKTQQYLSNPPGYGIQILELKPDCLNSVIQEIEQQDGVSFIPLR